MVTTAVAYKYTEVSRRNGKIRIRFPGPTHTGERFPKIAGRRTCFMGARFSYTMFRLRVRARKWSGRGSRRRKWFDLVQQRGRDATMWDTSSLSTSAGVKERRKETGETGLVFSVIHPAFYVPRLRSKDVRARKKLLFDPAPRAAGIFLCRMHPRPVHGYDAWLPAA